MSIGGHKAARLSSNATATPPGSTESPTSRSTGLVAEADRPVALAAMGTLAGGLILAYVELGPVSTHMAIHIGLMNVATPIAACLWMRGRPRATCLDRDDTTLLWLATTLQLILLLGWHTPAAHAAAMASAASKLAMYGSLLAVALLFWHAVLAPSRALRWKSVIALLVTGKIACLLGALWIFAPRELYAVAACRPTLYATHGVAGAHTLADQQLAGLLMVAACPLSYLVAGIGIVAQSLIKLGQRVRNSGSREPLMSAGR